jgi:hypothetical protein
MCTNHDYAVPATKGVRRFCVLDISSKKKGDTQYFTSLRNDTLNDEVQAAFLHEMLHRDLASYHSGKIPDTVGLKAQRMHSLDSVGKWLVDSFTQGYFETLPAIEQIKRGHNPEWQREISAHALGLSYMFWCDDNKIGEYGRRNKKSVGKYLTDIGYGKRHSMGTIRIFKDLDYAIELFEAYEKIIISD